MKPLQAIKQALPTVMSAISSIGVVVTTVLAINATPKAVGLIEEKNAKTPVEAVKACWKCYIPTLAVGVSTIICIFGTTTLTRRQQLALTSAYSLLETQFREYREKLKELYGEEAHRNVMKELAVEKAKDVHIYAPGIVRDSCLEFEGADEEPRLFYDSFSNRYFESTISKVLQAEIHLNRNFALGDEPSLNDFYFFLGLDTTEAGEKLGWTYTDGYSWIDFNHYKSTIDESMECWIIDTTFGPDLLVSPE